MCFITGLFSQVKDYLMPKPKNICDVQWRIQDFPDGVRQLQKSGRQPIIFASFPQKLHEIEEIWTERAARPWRPPWIRQWCESRNRLFLFVLPILSMLIVVTEFVIGHIYICLLQNTDLVGKSNSLDA